MMIPLQPILAKYKIIPRGIIHVGGHWGEEYEDYKKCGIVKMVWIEPCKEAFNTLMQRIDDENCILINVACGSKYEENVPMYVSHQNQGQSNSFLKPYLHLDQHRDIIFDDAEVIDKIVPLDSLPIEKGQYNILSIDTEGFEGEVLKGAVETIKHIDVIYTEINKAETRIGNLLVDELDAMLPEFTRVETFWPSPNFTWGDCILVRNTLLNE